jgi:hypothetical protein
MVPAVFRSRRQEASGMIGGLAACFTGLVDPRATRRCDHRLIDILVIAVIACVDIAETEALGCLPALGPVVREGPTSDCDRRPRAEPAAVNFSDSSQAVAD